MLLLDGLQARCTIVGVPRLAGDTCRRSTRRRRRRRFSPSIAYLTQVDVLVYPRPDVINLVFCVITAVLGVRIRQDHV
jgi:hypothetical protein